ncbi:hypothetical protein DY000_02061036 [Brassica cretica]|uniref:Uncharacterized protein n=1 Tax=Brassica cretica TaxID=69181 RepID=A0ABQ7APG2_BRACR|nr:hypothetical protein DY000_02061036 [Brassica cretica]
MFPKWEFDVEDPLAENIIKLMFVKKPWKWTMDCWEVTGTWVNTKSAVVSPAKKKVVKEDSPRPRKKARKEAPAEASEEAAAEASEEVTTTVGGLTKEDIKTMFKDIVDAMREGFGTCLKEIKYLSERVEAAEKKVGITTKRKGTSFQNTTSPPKPTLEPGSESVNGTNAGRKSLAEDKGLDVSADASSSKDKALEPSLVLLDNNQPTVSDLQKEDARYQEKRDAALALCRAKRDQTRKLAASHHCRIPLDKNHVQVELGDTVTIRSSSFNLFDIFKTHIIIFLILNPGVKVLMGRTREGRACRRIKKEDARYQEKRDAALTLFSAKSDRTRKLAASQQSPYMENSTAKVIIPNKKLYRGYNPFAPIDKKKLKELADWLKTCPPYRTPLDKKPRTSRTWLYHILRTSSEWLEDCRYDANPQHFRSERMCFLDHLFAQQWRFNYKDFKDSEPDQNGLGRRLPGGACNYYAGISLGSRAVGEIPSSSNPKTAKPN